MSEKDPVLDRLNKTLASLPDNVIIETVGQISLDIKQLTDEYWKQVELVVEEAVKKATKEDSYE